MGDYAAFVLRMEKIGPEQDANMRELKLFLEKAGGRHIQSSANGLMWGMFKSFCPGECAIEFREVIKKFNVTRAMMLSETINGASDDMAFPDPN